MNRIFFLVLISLFLHSCTETREENPEGTKNSETTKKDNLSSAGIKEADIEFKIEYIKPRRIYRIERQDLNTDGINEIIVFSVFKDTAERFNDYYNFDMMEVYALSGEKRAFVKILSDTVDYSKDYSFEDLANNKKKQIIINTYSGGNDAIASSGMFIFHMHSNNEINLIKYFDAGAPRIEDLGKDGIKEILVSDEFWGVMPHVNVISFVREIYNLENDKLIIKNSEFGKFYDDKIAEIEGKYFDLKRKVEIGMQPQDLSYPLYREAAEVIINYYAKGDIEGLRKFWDEQKSSLESNLPTEEFIDLSNFVSKALPLVKKNA